MIISASRRTDIPAFYSDWLLNRLRAGFVMTRNPFNAAQVRRVALSPDEVDCLVLWTKDPGPVLDRLDDLDALGYRYYFQFTLTAYEKELEPGLRDKQALLEDFRRLSERIGSHRVRWRYDPIVLCEGWDIPRHRAAFARLCTELAGYTEDVTISFVDEYEKLKSPLIRSLSEGEMTALAGSFAEIAGVHGLPVKTCCEKLDLTGFGVKRASCIDGALVERLVGHPLKIKPDRGQRPGCGCVSSVDIGAYNTCPGGCVYCYASHSPTSVARNRLRHDPGGEFLLLV